MVPGVWNRQRAESFKDENTVIAYRHRPPYPDETFQILAELIVDNPRVVLDIGCGSGAIARNLVNLVDRVDAVDFSLAMIKEGKRLSHGDSPRINWIYGKIENAPLNPPYALATAGMSLHWLDWEMVAPRFRDILTPNASIAILYNEFSPFPWDAELKELRAKVSNRDRRGFKPSNIADELEKQGKFLKSGIKETAYITFTQSIDAYIEQFHSRSDMARVWIGGERAMRFDNELRELIHEYIKGTEIKTEYRARVTWGVPIY